MDNVDLDVTLHNVVCCFHTRSHIKLRDFCMYASNVEYIREHGLVRLRLRKPATTSNIWASGKISVTGAKSEVDAKKAARRVARILQRAGYDKVGLHNYRVVNILAKCTLPFEVRLDSFATSNRDQGATYEPELHPAVLVNLTKPKATVQVFSTGSVTVTTPSIENLSGALSLLYPLVVKHKVMSEEQQKNSRNNGISYLTNGKPGLGIPPTASIPSSGTLPRHSHTAAHASQLRHHQPYSNAHNQSLQQYAKNDVEEEEGNISTTAVSRIVAPSSSSTTTSTTTAAATHPGHPHYYQINHLHHGYHHHQNSNRLVASNASNSQHYHHLPQFNSFHVAHHAPSLMAMKRRLDATTPVVVPTATLPTATLTRRPLEDDLGADGGATT